MTEIEWNKKVTIRLPKKPCFVSFYINKTDILDLKTHQYIFTQLTYVVVFLTECVNQRVADYHC